MLKKYQYLQYLTISLMLICSSHLNAAPPKSAGLETELGLNPILLVDQSKKTEEYELSAPSLALRPVVEWSLSNIFFIGMEWGLLWQQAKEKQLGDPSEKRLLMLPHARIRLDFPIYCRLLFEAVFAMGPNYWSKWRGASSPIGDRTVGLGYRFSAAFRFLINDQVDLLLGVGYQQEYGYGSYDLQFTQIPIQFGLRTQF